MNRDFTYEVWVQWSTLSKEEQDEFIEVRAEQWRLMQEQNEEEV
jgi:hypothetical protein